MLLEQIKLFLSISTSSTPFLVSSDFHINSGSARPLCGSAEQKRAKNDSLVMTRRLRRGSAAGRSWKALITLLSAGRLQPGKVSC